MSRGHTVLSLDLGTKLGWCLVVDGVIVNSGMVILQEPGGTQPAYRYLRFVNEVLSRFTQVNEITYEDIPFSTFADAHRVYCGLLAQLQVFCYVNKIRLVGENTMTVKKRFTGHGDATKADMCATAHKMGWSHGEPGTDLDHDEADAIATVVVALGRRGVAVTFK